MITDYKWPTNIYKKAFPFLGHTVGRDWNFINNTRKTLFMPYSDGSDYPWHALAV